MATEQELAQALSPAFGIYPKAFRGNTGNPQDAANLPVDVMRGRTAGLLGMFGDVVNQPSAFTPVRAVQLAMQGVMGQDKYPDTEHFLKTLPLKPTSRVGEVAGQAASFVPLNPAPAVRAGIAGAKALAPTAANMAEGYLQKQGLMPGVLPTFITDRSEVKNIANDFADQFKQMGFDVTLDHSGSKAGASSYLRVSDPQTGRFLSKPIRISDHSKGARELDANINVLNPQEDFAKITSALNDMRAKGDTLVFKQDRYAQELIASGVKPKTAYQRAKTEIAENQQSPYPQKAALDLAQQRAALPSDYYELNGLATQAYTDLRAKPSLETKNRYMEIIAARDEAVNNPSKNYQPPIPDAVPENYKGQHAAPTKGAGAPVWDLKGVYPDDFYSFNGAKYYGDGAEPVRDSMIVSQMQSMKGRPNADVTIYRAVPKSVSAKEALNVGDWITLDRKYAKEHGESALNNDYKIVSKKVKARDLYTNGDSIYEMGYDPQPREKSAK